VIDPLVVHELIEGARRPQRSPIDDLTPREREVLSLMARGMSNRAIAEELTLTKRAVEKQVSAIFAKLELPAGEDDDRRTLAVLAYVRP
jgi:DNA-binding NarL/FixJ family response regulator